MLLRMWMKVWVMRRGDIMIELVDEFFELVDDILWAGSVFGICGLDG